MLTISGKVLEVSTETITGGSSGSFQSTTVPILSGKSQVERVRIGRDFPIHEVPREGEDCTLMVVVSAFATRNGAGYRITALDVAEKAASHMAAV